MAVFVAASDESESRDGQFYWCGFIAPELDWSGSFAEAWQQQVLDGPPLLDFLHMTDWKSGHWRAKRGLSRDNIEARLDGAFRVIEQTQSLFPIGIKIDARRFRGAVENTKIAGRIGTVPYDFAPDYLGFLSYAIATLSYVNQVHPDCERVEFLVEIKRGVTTHVQDFHRSLSDGLQASGLDYLIPLIGDFLPVSKERVPVQAADLLCWYQQRFESNDLDVTDHQRFGTIAQRKGWKREMTIGEIDAFGDRMRAHLSAKHAV